MGVLMLAMVAARGADRAPLEAWLRHQAGIRSLEAEFVQERRLPALKQPVMTRGRLAFRRPGFLRWELGDPAATVVVADGTTLVLAEVTEKRARRMAFDAPDAQRFTLLAGDAFRDAGAFRAAFELRESRVEGGFYQATLQPVERRLRARVPWLFLTIDPGDNRLIAFEIELQDGSRIRSVFERPKFNGVLPDQRFQFDLTGYRVR
jgi:outer membrane lipoprotein-sorting protein